MTDMKQVAADLTAEGEQLDAVVASLDADQWALETPAPGWTIAHQIAHLSATFRIAALAAAQPETFKALIGGMSDDFDANVADALAPYLADPATMLERWRGERAGASQALEGMAPDQPVPWFVGHLNPVILASAGMMELFAHGQDIADTVGVEIERTDRIRYLATFGARNRDFGYLFRGLTPPDEEFRFELVAPSGQTWTFGPPDSTQRISGPAVDFCLLVTRRRHRDDLALVAIGEEADRWLDIAQAYRGSPGPGRSPRQFASLQR